MKTKKRKFGLKQFVDVANAIHNNFYDYSKFVYLGNNIKGIIICPIHGEFLQYPSTHIKGANCHKCVFIRRGNNCRLGKEKFIEKCNLIHNNKYDYSNVNYVTSMEKVEIICLDHGSFWMRPNDHLSGEQGCPQCFGKKKHTLSSFIHISKIKHNDIYDYSKVLYKDYRKHIIIICKKHGEFKQAPKNHMRGLNC